MEVIYRLSRLGSCSFTKCMHDRDVASLFTSMSPYIGVDCYHLFTDLQETECSHESLP